MVALCGTLGWVCVRVLLTICTPVAARSSDRRLQCGVHALVTRRASAHLRGTTARMGKGQKCGVEAAPGTERPSTSQPSLPELSDFDPLREIGLQESRAHSDRDQRRYLYTWMTHSASEKRSW